MKRLTIILMITCLLLVGALPVSADQPQVVYDGPFSYSWYLDWVNCGQYGYNLHVWKYVEGRIKVTWYFDKDGVLVRELWHQQGMNYFYSEENPDYRFASSFSIVYHQDLMPDEQLWHVRYTGVYYNLNMPGIGNVIHFGGQNEQYWRLDWSELVGIRDVGHDTWDIEALCRALAQ